MTSPEFLEPGRHYPMGAHARDGGVNFAVFSDHADAIDVCLFDEGGQHELRRYRLRGPQDSVFQGFLPGAGPGLVYGLRAHGPHRPEAGHLFNPNKLLLDPCAREIVGCFQWHPANHGYTIGDDRGLRSLDPRDNAGIALKARVAAPDTPAPGWFNAPRHRDADVVLYELHVKGFSKTHPGIPEDLRGTYAALAHPVAIDYFKSLGVTTLSLLPVQYCVDEGPLVERGLVNYWGYNTLGFFCPDPRLARADADPSAVAAEFRAMVDSLHQHGLEVVLDVVYNHTPEGSEFGPTLSFRGLDQASWYRLMRDDRSRCENLSGCGNTLNVAHPKVTQFVLDSLRYWVREMGVDGFRFDLAPVLGRGSHGFDPSASFFIALRQDPILAGARLIAEPWDAGPQGYQVGHFPGRFGEWNDKFRDAVRGYWLRRGVDRGEFARRFTASDDLFHHHQRRPTASINFIAVHDGFTLADLVSYNRKHNLANGEDNRDGRDNELSGNLGVEGATEDKLISALRRRVRRAMIGTLLLAQGTPMLCAGDEIGNSQQGNNNAYCQDNQTAWLDWAAAEPEFREFVAEVLALRKAEPLLHHDRWFASAIPAKNADSLVWRSPTGDELSIQDWHDQAANALSCLITPIGDTVTGKPANARLMLLFNPDPQVADFELPEGKWQLALDSSGILRRGHASLPYQLQVPAHTLLVLRNSATDS
jgi:glycogen operon protein